MINLAMVDQRHGLEPVYGYRTRLGARYANGPAHTPWLTIVCSQTPPAPITDSPGIRNVDYYDGR